MLDVIDLTGLGGADPAAVRRVACQNSDARAAMSVSSMFATTAFRMPSYRAFSAARRRSLRHRRPPRMNWRSSRSPHNRGYVGIATESLNLAQADLKEAFNIGLDLSASDPDVVAGKPFRGVNLWPADPGVSRHRSGLFRCHVAAGGRAASRDRGRSRTSARLILPTSSIGRWRRCGCCIIRLGSHGPGSLPGAGEHTDYGSLTILLNDAVGRS